MNFSKIDSEKIDFRIISFNIEAESNKILCRLKHLADEKKLKLDFKSTLEADKKIFIGDPTRICQVLASLLGNALKFTSQGNVSVLLSIDNYSRIKSSTCSSRTVVRIEVKDTGIGITDEAQARLFQPFVQVESSANRRFGGMGLGLAICKHLVEIMGGCIGVRSNRNGGSTFWFTVRLDQVTADAPEIEEEVCNVTPTNFSPQKIRVLIAEDNLVNQIISQNMLEKHGFRVDVVANGKEALQALKSAPYGLVFRSYSYRFKCSGAIAGSLAWIM